MINIYRLFKSFRYALKGLLKIFKTEQNLRIQSFLGILAIFSGVIFTIKPLEWALLFIVIGMVLLMETINSAVERVADLLKPRLDTYVKEIKDIMAAGVMLASFLALAVGLIIFWPYVF